MLSVGSFLFSVQSPALLAVSYDHVTCLGFRVHCQLMGLLLGSSCDLGHSMALLPPSLGETGFEQVALGTAHMLK